MARAKADIELNSAGIRALLKSPGVRRDITQRAERVARAAGDGHVVEVTEGPSRARASVRTATPAAKAAEARYRKLTASLDAAR